MNNPLVLEWFIIGVQGISSRVYKGATVAVWADVDGMCNRGSSEFTVSLSRWILNELSHGFYGISFNVWFSCSISYFCSAIMYPQGSLVSMPFFSLGPHLSSRFPVACLLEIHRFASGKESICGKWQNAALSDRILSNWESERRLCDNDRSLLSAIGHPSFTRIIYRPTLRFSAA